ncbi:MAG TPA: type II secretion system protein [Candidatus Omnitrophota bacterium]|nr:type II secretion system protein [Candidatus Omnitrophota bacterium]HPD83998.1 type II secretion system protein [Candidatus Omnitrophota bacterium]HRZ02855.1 type II secretion system protein [Candidatus Omnitrophota bacterium]
MNNFKDSDCRGFTLFETLVSVSIFAIAVTGVFLLLLAGQSTFFNAGTSIEAQQSLRMALVKVTRELQESGIDNNGVSQVTILQGAGPNGTDILRFSMPVICHSGDSVINSSGDVAHWGAPLTWGCTSSSCMDADNDCMTLDYKYVEYSKNAQNELIRKVLNNGGGTVREDLVAQDILDFQAAKSTDEKTVTLQMSTQKKSVVNRVVGASTSTEIYLRNRG